MKKKSNGDRKRMINIDFVLKQLFKMLDLPIEKDVPLSKPGRTLAFHKRYWAKGQLLIGDSRLIPLLVSEFLIIF